VTRPSTLAGAIVASQALAVAVEKSSQNSHQRYSYASAEAIMQTGTECLGAYGLALVCQSWQVLPPEPSGGEGHFATVSATFLLIHESGETREFGPWTMPAVAGRGRPPDKAVSTALTYLQGYGLRGVLNLPRVDEGSEVDARDDGQRQPAQARQQQRKAEPAAQQGSSSKDGDREKYLKEWRAAWQSACGLHGTDAVVAQALKMGSMTNERGKGLNLQRIKAITSALDLARKPDPRAGTRGGGNRSNSS